MAMRGAVLLTVQCVLVLSTAGKYLWERHERPAVWTRVDLFNGQPWQPTARDPLNRYIEAQLLVDACGLPQRAPTMDIDFTQPFDESGKRPEHPVRKDVVRPAAKSGTLVAAEAVGLRKSDTQALIWDLRKPCTEARLTGTLKFYVPSNEAMTNTLKPGKTLWALVTVPEQGPPRPIELAISDATGWHPLDQK